MTVQEIVDLLIRHGADYAIGNRRFRRAGWDERVTAALLAPYRTPWFTSRRETAAARPSSRLDHL